MTTGISGRSCWNPSSTLLATLPLVLALYPESAKAISNGDEVDPCEWPTVVLVEDPPWPTSNLCFVDDEAECPSVSILGASAQLKCEPANAKGADGGPGPAGSCFYESAEEQEPDYVTNWVQDIRFGEEYVSKKWRHPFNSIAVQYCKVVADIGSGSGGDPADFAYCVLTEEPALAPIPMITACEVDEYLDGGQPLDVRIVGFGGTGTVASGRKRTASAVVQSDISSAADLVSYTRFTGFVPGPPTPGDSGGGVFVKLPDGTWRLLGVMATGGSAGQFVPVWRHVEWMLEDAQVELDEAALLPCHNQQGEWAPKSNCGEFPVSPDLGMGAWARGSTSCFNPKVGPATPTRPTSCALASDPLPPPPLDPPVGFEANEAGGDMSEPDARALGCAVARTPGADRWGPMTLLLMMLLPLVRRHREARRRRALGALSIASLLWLMLGCVDKGGATTGGDETAGETGAEPEVMELNPHIHRVTSGETFAGVSYEEIAVGNVVRPISDSACCLDYIVGGTGQPEVELVRGGGSQDSGLTFLSETSNTSYTMADDEAGVDDLALTDLDGDGNNDLVALTTNAELAVRLGQPDEIGGPLGDNVQYPFSTPQASAALNIAIGTLDANCDGSPDLVAVAPDDDAVVTLTNDGDGGFGGASRIGVGDNPRDVAVGALDDNGRDDIVTINGDGTFSVVLGECAEAYGAATTDEAISFVHPMGDCELGGIAACVHDANIATLEIIPVCGGARPDVVVAFADSIFAYCNDGSGGFEGLDHHWDLNDKGVPQLDPHLVTNPIWWAEADALYIIMNRRTLVRLTRDPDVNNLYKRNFIPILNTNGAAPITEAVLSPHTGDSAVWWERLAWVGPAMNHSEIGFGR